MTDRPYMVIYPKGDRTTLSTAYVRFYQRDDWDLASQECFEDREAAEDHARRLARKHGLALDKEIPLLLNDVPPLEDGTMHLYSWESQAMAGYYRGQIIVMAPSLAVARDLARRRFEVTMPAGYEALAKLDEDLSREPDILGSGVALIRGGD